MEELGFIMLRHVNNMTTDEYWRLSYDCIRKHYPENIIIIIDDNSDPSYLSSKELYKTVIIDSEYPKRGELLPYIYYLRIKMFETAVIIHDSVFIQQKINFAVDTCVSLWNFEHHWDQPEDEWNMISHYNDRDLNHRYNDKNSWKGCFGGMMSIRHDYLKKMDEKYSLDMLIIFINTRYNRCSFERVISVLLSDKTSSFFGDITNNRQLPFGTPYERKDEYSNLPIIKVWTGR